MTYSEIVNLLDNPAYSLLFLILVIWTLAWKGVALWKAAQNGQKKWFIAILIINTLGILEIIYLFYFAKTNNGQTKNSQSNSLT